MCIELCIWDETFKGTAYFLYGKNMFNEFIWNGYVSLKIWHMTERQSNLFVNQ